MPEPRSFFWVRSCMSVFKETIMKLAATSYAKKEKVNLFAKKQCQKERITYHFEKYECYFVPGVFVVFGNKRADYYSYCAYYYRRLRCYDARYH
jgi:hypothetical protein